MWMEWTFSSNAQVGGHGRKEEGGVGGGVCSGAVRESSSPYTKTQYVLG